MNLLISLFCTALLVTVPLYAAAKPLEDGRQTGKIVDVPNRGNEKVLLAAAQVLHDDTPIMDKLIANIDRAGKEGAQLIALPEYVIGPETLKPLSPNMQKLADAAIRNNIYVVVGVWQDLKPGGLVRREKDAFANTAVILGRDGKVVGTYSKTHRATGDQPYFWPPKEDEPEYLMKAGDGYPTFQLDFAKVGIMICYDGYFPESSQCLSLNGAEIIIWINCRGGVIEDYLLKSDMFRCTVDMVATNSGIGAGATIGAFPTQFVARTEQTGDQYVSGVLDLHHLRLYRANSRMYHQRRPGLYKSIVEEHKTW